MRGLVLAAGGKLSMREVEQPCIKNADDVKIRIHATGICGTDLKIMKGKVSAAPGKIIGHEAVGTVTETGNDVTNVKSGDRVLINPTQYCGKCHYCRIGLTSYCETFEKYQLGIGTNGTYADFYVGREKFVYKIPDSMSWEQALMVEPLTCVYNVITKAGINPEDSVLVIGSGPIGSLCQLMCSKTARLCAAIEPDPYRLKFAGQFSDYAFSPDDFAFSKIPELNGRKFDVVIDAVGDKVAQAFGFVEKGGRIVPMGYDETYNFTCPARLFYSQGVTVVGTGEVHLMTEKALEYVSAFKESERIVTGEYPLDEYEKAIDTVIGIDRCTGAPIPRSNMKAVLLSE